MVLYLSSIFIKNFELNYLLGDLPEVLQGGLAGLLGHTGKSTVLDFKQVVGTVELDDLAVVYHEYDVAVNYGLKSVGHRQDGAVLELGVYGLADERVCRWVDVSAGFVED